MEPEERGVAQIKENWRDINENDITAISEISKIEDDYQPSELSNTFIDDLSLETLNTTFTSFKIQGDQRELEIGHVQITERKMLKKNQAEETVISTKREKAMESNLLAELDKKNEEKAEETGRGTVSLTTPLPGEKQLMRGPEVEVSEDYKNLKRKHNRLKMEFNAQREKRVKDKEKIVILTEKLKEERKGYKDMFEDQEKKFKDKVAEKEDDLRDTLICVLNELNEALGLGIARASIDLPVKKLNMMLGQAAGMIIQKHKSMREDTSGDSRMYSDHPRPSINSQKLLSEPQSQAETIDSISPGKELRLKLHTLKNNFYDTLIGGGFQTIIAMKDELNFLIGTSKKGLILFKDGRQIYAEYLPENGQSLQDIVYARTHNSYFFCHHNAIYKKTNDKSPPTPHITLSFGQREKPISLKFSPVTDRLVINLGTKNSRSKLAVVEPSADLIEMMVPSNNNDFIKDFKLFGDNQENVIYVTEKGFVGVAEYSGRHREGDNGLNSSLGLSFFNKKVDLKLERKEKLASVSVCLQNRFACVTSSMNSNGFFGGLRGLFSNPGKPVGVNYSSRLMVFEINMNSCFLVMKACIDCFNQQIGRMLAFNFLGYIGDRALFVGVSCDTRVLHILDYNSVTEKFVERGMYRMSIFQEGVTQLIKVGRWFYYTGQSANLVRLSIDRIHGEEGLGSWFYSPGPSTNLVRLSKERFAGEEGLPETV